MKRAQIVVPASSANLGPGFDCLGIALSLYHRLTVTEVEGEGVEIRVTGEVAAKVPLDCRNAVYQAMAQIFAAAGYRPGRLLLECHCDIPLACGLGSSAAALLAGLAAGLLISGQELERQRLIEMGVSVEGHPDNIVPSVLGGFTAAVVTAGRVDYARLEPPEGLGVVVAIPDFSLSTNQARAVLPRQVSFQDAVANLGRVGLLTAAMASRRLELLRTAMVDVLHEPYRLKLVPGLEEVRRAALEAGALGVALSGAGPTILALVDKGEEEVGRAMQAAWGKQGIRARSAALTVNREGLQGGLCQEGGE